MINSLTDGLLHYTLYKLSHSAKPITISEHFCKAQDKKLMPGICHRHLTNHSNYGLTE